MPEMTEVTLNGERYTVPVELTMTPMQLMARQFDQWAEENPIPPGSASVKAAKGWVEPIKLGSVVRVTQEMIDDAPPSLDTLMRWAQEANLRRYVATQNELRWQDVPEYDSPAVERGYN